MFAQLERHAPDRRRQPPHVAVVAEHAVAVIVAAPGAAQIAPVEQAVVAGDDMPLDAPAGMHEDIGPEPQAAERR